MSGGLPKLWLMPSLWASSSSPIISRVGSVKKSYVGGCITGAVGIEGKPEEFATHAKKNRSRNQTWPSHRTS